VAKGINKQEPNYFDLLNGKIPVCCLYFNQFFFQLSDNSHEQMKNRFQFRVRICNIDSFFFVPICFNKIAQSERDAIVLFQLKKKSLKTLQKQVWG